MSFKRNVFWWLKGKTQASKENPYGERFTYVNNVDAIRKRKIREYKIWYSGDSDELLNFYTNQITYGYDRDPIYNRNAKEYFWSIASGENGFKRVHSGVPNAIISTLCNIVGYPHIQASDDKLDETLQDILQENDFRNIVNQKQLPLTLVCGEGAFKINIDKELSDNPIISFYDAERVHFEYVGGKLVGITYVDYYYKDRKEYILYETRHVDKENSYITYRLYENVGQVEGKEDERKEVPLSKLGLDLEDIVIKGYNKILGVESKIFVSSLDQEHGRSLFAGKIDIFDDLDLVLSQASQTVRVSTPIEYYNPEILPRSVETGEVGMPHVFNRQYIKKLSSPDGDGNVNDDIVITQPKLNADEYGTRYLDLLKACLTGVLSPATLGIDTSLRDNAKAQREKEKTTIFLRRNIVDSEVKIIRELCTLLLDAKELMEKGTIKKVNKDITVNFEKFANPTFEEEIVILGNAFTQGQISPEKYVETLWGDSLSEEDKQKEIAYLKEYQLAFRLDQELLNETRLNQDSEKENRDYGEDDRLKDKVYHENI